MFEERIVKDQKIATIRDVIERQLNREMDHVRSKDAWTRVLEAFTTDEIVSALVEELSFGKYMLTPRCPCCMRHR